MNDPRCLNIALAFIFGLVFTVAGTVLLWQNVLGFGLLLLIPGLAALYILYQILRNR